MPPDETLDVADGTWTGEWETPGRPEKGRVYRFTGHSGARRTFPVRAFGIDFLGCYLGAGGLRGPLGPPTSLETTVLDAWDGERFRVQDFDGGLIGASPGGVCHVIRRPGFVRLYEQVPIDGNWRRANRMPLIGWPLEAEQAGAGFHWQRFRRGIMVEDGTDRPSKLILEPIASYVAQDVPARLLELGMPLTPPVLHAPSSEHHLTHVLCEAALALGEERDDGSNLVGAHFMDPADQTLPYNCHRWLSSHNAYESKPTRAHRDVTGQLDLGVRSLEFDARPDAPFHVYHHGGPGRPLAEYLDEVRQWSLRTPLHDPLTVFIEVKKVANLSSTMHVNATVLDGVLKAAFADSLYTPMDLARRGARPSGEQGAIASDYGWDTLAQMRGRVLFVLTASEDTLEQYRTGGGRQAFSGLNVRTSNVLNDISDPRFAFLNLRTEIQHRDRPLIYRAWVGGRVLRGWWIKNETEWNAARGTYMQHVAMDWIPVPGHPETRFNEHVHLQQPLFDRATGEFNVTPPPVQAGVPGRV